MNAALRHPLRATRRLLWFAGELTRAALMLAWRRRRGPLTPTEQALWLQETSRRVLRIFRLEPQFSGEAPTAGLLVCNHLSYLDVLVIAAITPAMFVAKSDVTNWPVFGWFARQGGTIFVDRQHRAQAADANAEIAAALESGALVVLFPEGSSSDGHTVLPFKSSLLEPAAQSECPIFSGRIGYALADGDIGEEVCYWKDHTLAPHLLNLMGKRAVGSSIHFAPYTGRRSNRKELARALRYQVGNPSGRMKPELAPR